MEGSGRKWRVVGGSGRKWVEVGGSGRKKLLIQRSGKEAKPVQQYKSCSWPHPLYKGNFSEEHTEIRFMYVYSCCRMTWHCDTQTSLLNLTESSVSLLAFQVPSQKQV